MIKRWLLGFLLVDFVLLSTWATWKVGYLGIFAAALNGPGEMQIFADLCIALLFASGWLKRDAERRGINPWTWIVAIVPMGSLSIVGYLAAREAGVIGRAATASEPVAA